MKDRVVSYLGDDYGIRNVHNLLLGMLEKFDEHCKAYNITYSLAYGSMLGCVRNHGFIPWDDDVDVVMSRLNYDRFFDSIKEGKTRLAHDCFVEMPLFLPKLHDRTTGDVPVFIDVYAADNIPDNRIRGFFKLCSIQIVKEIIKGRCNHMPGLVHIVRKMIAYAISFPFSVEKLRDFYTKLCTSDNGTNTKRMGSYCTGHKSMGKYYSALSYLDVEYLEFETIKMPIMKDFDVYLSKEYGVNYMTPISSSKRNPGHVKFKK